MLRIQWMIDIVMLMYRDCCIYIKMTKDNAFFTVELSIYGVYSDEFIFVSNIFEEFDYDDNKPSVFLVCEAYIIWMYSGQRSKCFFPN